MKRTSLDEEVLFLLLWWGCGPGFGRMWTSRGKHPDELDTLSIREIVINVK
jgi:hypothetical protein